MSYTGQPQNTYPQRKRPPGPAAAYQPPPHQQQQPAAHMYSSQQHMPPPGAYMQPAPAQGPMLFEDTSHYNQGQGFGDAPGSGSYAKRGRSMLADPVVSNMAMQYGENLMDQGKEYMDEKINQYVSVSTLKYYFAVDNHYVLKKLALILFPFTHSDWSVKYNQDEPVQPKFEINAPDLYIPTMSFVTYILTSGVLLGLQKRFSPEQLGITSSTALVWLILELAVIWITMYVCNITAKLSFYDTLTYSSYKYVGMILCMLSSLFSSTSTVYYCVLLYVSICITFFTVRSLKLQLLPQASEDSSAYQHGRKRSMYLLLFIGFLQPTMMFWLTWHTAVYNPAAPITDPS